VYLSGRMYPAFQEFLRDLWRDSPSLVILFGGGAILFALLVIDTYRHRKKRKDRHRITRFH
jgi:hypothetical protein